MVETYKHGTATKVIATLQRVRFNNGGYDDKVVIEHLIDYETNTYIRQHVSIYCNSRQCGNVLAGKKPGDKFIMTVQWEHYSGDSKLGLCIVSSRKQIKKVK